MAEIDPMRAFGLLNDGDLAGEASQELGQDQGVVQGPPAPGELVDGRFRLMAPLGQGGMGTVFRGFDEHLEREVAIKILSLGGSAARKRFSREAEVTARLRHPHVIRIHGSGQVRGHPYLTYELIEGGRSLLDALVEEPLSTRLDLLEQVAEGLAAAHAIGVVHRDLKPENVLLRATGEAVVADFGLAALDASSLTKTGQSMGTPAYMAPEQIRGDSPTPACDVWALGLLLYEVLYQVHAFLDEGEGLQPLLARIYEARLELPPGGPPRLRRLVQRCLVSDAAQRPPDAGAFLAALVAARAPTRPIPAPLFWGSVFALLLAIGGVAVVAQRGAPVEPSSPAASPEDSMAQLPASPPASSPSPEPEGRGWAHSLSRVRRAAFFGDRLAIVTRAALHVFDSEGVELCKVPGYYRNLREGRQSLWFDDRKRVLRLGESLEPELIYVGKPLDVDPVRGEFLVLAEGGFELRDAKGELVRSLRLPFGAKGISGYLLPNHVLVSTWHPKTRNYVVRRDDSSSKLVQESRLVSRVTATGYSADREQVAFGTGDGMVHYTSADLGRFQPLRRKRGLEEGPERFSSLAVQAHLNKVTAIYLSGDRLLSYARPSGDPSRAVLWSTKTLKDLVVKDASSVRAFAVSPSGILATVTNERVEFTPLENFR